MLLEKEATLIEATLEMLGCFYGRDARLPMIGYERDGLYRLTGKHENHSWEIDTKAIDRKHTGKDPSSSREMPHTALRAPHHFGPSNTATQDHRPLSIKS